MRKSLRYSHYHRFLRVSAVVFAAVLMFESGLFSRATVPLAQKTNNYLANVVGISAAVEPTELNKYTAALTRKEQELNAREAALREREVSVGLAADGETGTKNDTVIYILTSILFILLILILLNYLLDYLRYRENKTVETKTV